MNVHLILKKVSENKIYPKNCAFAWCLNNKMYNFKSVSPLPARIYLTIIKTRKAQ